MARKVAETVQVNLRLKEGLRRRLAREAERNKISMTKQILIFLEDGLERQDRFELAQIVTDLQVLRARVAHAVHGLDKQGDVIVVLEKLIAALPADLRDQPKIKHITAQAENVLKMIDAEAALALRRMHTTGSDQT